MANWMSHFSGRHVILTGGSSGIGKAIAHDLAAAGAKMTLIARRSSLLDETREDLRARHANAEVHVLPLDIADEARVTTDLNAHLDVHPPDILVNNAGIARPGRFLEQTNQDFRDHMNINFFGMVHLTRVVAPRLVERGWGHIANVGSLLSIMGIYGYTAYASSKFAMQGFTECLRAELKPHGVSVTILQPPDTDTPQHSAELEIMPAETRAIAGTVKMLSPEKVGRALLEGMAAGKFEVIPGVDGRVTAWAHRWMPGVVRWYCDGSQAKA